jgi:hypothetical protein
MYSNAHGHSASGILRIIRFPINHYPRQFDNIILDVTECGLGFD